MSNQSIYLSYAAADAAFIDGLQRDLLDRGFTLAVNRHTAPPGQPLEATIREAVTNAARVIICFSSRNGLPTTYDTSDLLLAMEQIATSLPADHSWLIPVKLTPCELPQLPIGTRSLRELATIDLYADWATGMTRLIEALPRPDRVEENVAPRNTATPQLEIKADSIQTDIFDGTVVDGFGPASNGHSSLEARQVVATRFSITTVRNRR